MEKLEDSQIKDRAEYNVAHNLIGVDLDLNIAFNFHIYKGRLFWVKDKQKIFMERMRLIPGELGGKLVLTSRYDDATPAEGKICEVVNAALEDPAIKKTIQQYLKSMSNGKTNESIDLMNQYGYLSQIHEAATAKNIKTRDEEHDDKLVQNIIKSGNDYYIIVDKASTPGHYKAVQVYNGATNKFMVQRIPDLDLTSASYTDADQEFKELASKSANKIFDETGENSYENIDKFKLACLTRFDSITDKPEEDIVEKNVSRESAASASGKGIDTESDDIYGAHSIDDFPNIRALGQYKNPDGSYMDIQFQFSITSLELSKAFGWDNNANPSYDITPAIIKNTLLDYREAKKGNLYINGINKRPKDCTRFMEAILPIIHLEFQGIKKTKYIKIPKAGTPAPAGGAPAAAPAPAGAAPGAAPATPPPPAP